MSFNCSKCLVNCRADCCRGAIPIPKNILNHKKPVRSIDMEKNAGEGYYLVASFEYYENGDQGLVCPYLGYDNKCSIYYDRPFPCRDFGTENSVFTICSYQAKDGRIRKRAERRYIERKIFKERDKTLNILRFEVSKNNG